MPTYGTVLAGTYCGTVPAMIWPRILVFTSMMLRVLTPAAFGSYGAGIYIPKLGLVPKHVRPVRPVANLYDLLVCFGAGARGPGSLGLAPVVATASFPLINLPNFYLSFTILVSFILVKYPDRIGLVNTVRYFTVCVERATICICRLSLPHA